jgi:hypothetical protein
MCTFPHEESRMWNPPIELRPEEQKIAKRTQKARKCFVLLRPIRHQRLDTAFQTTLAQSESPEPGGKAPVAAGLLALATLLQAYCHVGDREAVERPVLDKRWQRVLDCLGAAPPPCSQGTLWPLRMRRLAHNLDKTLLERTVALAEQTGGFGARQRRAVLDSTPLFGAGRGEDTVNLLGHALRKAVGLAAKALGTSAEGLMEDAGLELVGQSRLKAALALDGGAPTARASALRLILAEVERGQSWSEQQRCRSTQEPPMQEMRDTLDQSVAQDTEPDPEGGPGARRLRTHVAPDRRSSIEDADMRHGRKSRSKTFNGFTEHFALALESKGTRAVVVRPANEPEHEAGELLAGELEQGPGLRQLDIALGSRASPRIVQWAEQGGHISARPWPHVGHLFTKNDCPLDCVHGKVTCPHGDPVPMSPGRLAQCPASACEACPVRAQCTKARLGQGRSLSRRADEQFQHTLRAKIRTKRGRASLRTRTAVEHAISHH